MAKEIRCRRNTERNTGSGRNDTVRDNNHIIILGDCNIRVDKVMEKRRPDIVIIEEGRNNFTVEESRSETFYGTKTS